jgi:hypothetical protein
MGDRTAKVSQASHAHSSSTSNDIAQKYRLSSEDPSQWSPADWSHLSDSELDNIINTIDNMNNSPSSTQATSGAGSAS